MANICRSCLICPITFCLFVDPVIAEDEYTYERSAITRWIECNNTSPLTRTTITIEGLRPNRLVKQMVEEFKAALSEHQYKFKLGRDIERSQPPFFQTTGKSLYDAKWIGYPNGPPIVLLKLSGARAKREASFYEFLTRHPHIVYTYGLVEPLKQEPTFVMLLQEKAPGGSLLNYLDQHSEREPEKYLSNKLFNEIFRQIANAMIFLIDKNIIHGDIACRNVLVFRIDENEPEKTLVKLTDFGISRGNAIYSKIDAVETVIDTVPIRSAPPEVLQGEPCYSEKSDMFAMAVLMCEVFTYGKLPWGEIEKESIIRVKVIKGERLPRPKSCTSDCQWNLILKCMAQNPDDRPTFRELEEQLKELILSDHQSNPPPSLTQSNSVLQTIVTSEQSETNNLTEQVQSPSQNVPETVLTDSENSPESSTTSFCAGVDVKARRRFFEQKIDQNRLLPPLGTKPSIKSVVNKLVPPPKELIKLTKWH